MNPIIISKSNCQKVQTSSVRLLTLAAGALLLVAGATTSCSTTKGFGRDVEKTGDKIQNAASAAQN
jgi:predicted small secreted protein